jgi:hypothetical protein
MQPFALKTRLSSDSTADPHDVIRLKRVLNRLGYYQPLNKIGMTDIPDKALFDALAVFQRAHHLDVTGKIKPDDLSEKYISFYSTQTPPGSYIWRTVEDEKVRSEHASYNRTVRAWSDHPAPGDDFNCRCWAQPVEQEVWQIHDPPLKPVYPELLLLTLSPARWLYNAWKLWALARGTNWSIGKHKTERQWANRIENREWTPQQITDTIRYGKRYPAPNKVYPSHTATRYEYKGRYVVRDDINKEILQVSGPKFSPNKLVP